MSLIASTIQKSITQGQKGMEKHITYLIEQNDTIIANENEMIDLMQAICKKLDIPFKTDDTTEEHTNAE